MLLVLFLAGVKKSVSVGIQYFLVLYDANKFLLAPASDKNF